MNPRELAVAAVRGDDLRVRQIVKDASRAGYRWGEAPAPDFAGRRCRAVYASIVELLAGRAGDGPPSWVAGILPAPLPIFLMGRGSAFIRRQCEARAPESMRKRNVLALPEYLDVL